MPLWNRIGRLALLIVCAAVSLAERSVLAGGGPQNLLLVVNANSNGSKQVANHYVRLREIPASNVLYLDYDGPTESVRLEEFREAILGPLLRTIDERRLSAQIDMVAYSTDFPWRVDLRGAFEKGRNFSKGQLPFASLTGATYLYGFTMHAPQALLALDSNWYVPSPGPMIARRVNLFRCTRLGNPTTRGFRSAYSWKPGGIPTADRKQGRRYLMSTSLGVTTGRGLAIDEVIAAVRRGVEAEANPPNGTFYYLRNDNVRSKPRDAGFASAVALLRQAGAKAVVREGVVPTGARDVAGLMTGAEDLELAKARLVFQPGAIAEHLTSYGGMLYDKNWQMPMTDLLRAGATGVSGTVHEPTALQAKFPMPSLHVHYRRGASLAEAFYLSVASPYQLLVMGDPLCQPWAKRPGLKVEGWPSAPEGSLKRVWEEMDPFDLRMGNDSLPGTVKRPKKSTPDAAGPESGDRSKDASDATTADGEPVADPNDVAEGTLVLTPEVTAVGGGGGSFSELYLDGRLVARARSGKPFTLSTEVQGVGWRELRCVGFASDPVQAQRVQVGAIERVDPAQGVVEPTRLTIDDATVAMGERLAVSAVAPGAERIAIRQNSREVGSISGERGGAFLSTELLGAGPVRLQAVAVPSGAASPPQWVEVR